MQAFQSDGVRAAAVLLIALAGAAGIVTTRAPASADSAAVPVVYTIINMTERLADRHNCPLDLASARSRIEAGFADTNFLLEYSPLADGPDVFLHELAASASPGTTGAEPSCIWTIRVSYKGRSMTRQARTAPSRTADTLESLAQDSGALLVTETR
ncbi:hypothetical protein [Maricaulis maris]|uniref:Uncharacterized protein n=1 Tax=Maricaulis maris TaxID=74318 RepID=A0A495D283_9PROT|nr:hypothetical protein [Maricaulis maris]RKQ95654.1 hypothetical protein C7435_2760 [Maricaulis maris]